MSIGLLGQKIGMTSVYDANGQAASGDRDCGGR